MTHPTHPPTALPANGKDAVDILSPQQCSGCFACHNICPVDAIEMVMDAEGFYYPQIDAEKCTHCGICLARCPGVNFPRLNDATPEAYAIKSDDTVMRGSTSAGIFAILAEHVISQGGCVAGAVFDEHFDVVHILADTREEVARIRRSKYVQSHIGTTYKAIRAQLRAQRLVLFSGCPCQVAGLRNYLKKPYDNLWTLDIFCHGVPSPGNWRRYLDENISREQLANIDFRHKGNFGFQKHRIAWRYTDGTQHVQTTRENTYYKHFNDALGLRPSCAACQGAVTPRAGDFSAGDFWGAKKHYPDLIDSDRGLSVLLLNNARAKDLFETTLKPQFTLVQPLSLAEAMSANRNRVTRKMHPNRRLFFKMLSTHTFNDAVERNANQPKYDVAIGGITVGADYGNLAGYYALYTAVKHMGYSAIMLNKPTWASSPPSSAKAETHEEQFCRQHIPMTPAKPIAQFHQYNDIADTFLLGSAQVWNWQRYKYRQATLYLNFADDSKKKLAYAASFGTDPPSVLQPSLRQHYPTTFHLLHRFDAVSVREPEAVSMCDEHYALDATLVADPVFLIPPDDYAALAQTATCRATAPFITAYFLAPDTDAQEAVTKTAQTLNLPVVGILSGDPKQADKHSAQFPFPTLSQASLTDWLCHLQHCDFVVTDAYHGLCFAIIFRKPFWLFSSAPLPAHTRHLLTKLALSHRHIRTSSDLEKMTARLREPIDWDAVYRLLTPWVDASHQWLQHALAAPKQVRVDTRLPKPAMALDKLVKQFHKVVARAAKAPKTSAYILMICDTAPQCLAHLKMPPQTSLQLPPSTADAPATPWVHIADQSAHFSQTAIGDFGFVSHVMGDVRLTATTQRADNANAEIIVSQRGDKQVYSIASPGVHFLVFDKQRHQLTHHITADFNALRLDVHSSDGIA